MLSHYQKGLSPIGVLAVTCLFALFLVSGLKLIPHYLDYGSLKMIYEDVNQKDDLGTMSAQDIYSAIYKSLVINSLSDFDIRGNSIISKEAGRTKVGLDYEVREHLFGNINVVLTFQYMPE